MSVRDVHIIGWVAIRLRLVFRLLSDLQGIAPGIADQDIRPEALFVIRV
jgi:hypothetical protein